MKPIEYLCLAILIAVVNLLPGKWYLDLITWALVVMWVVGSLRTFRKDQEARGQ